MTKVCICENYQGLSQEDGTPVLKCYCTTIETIESKEEPLAQTIFDQLGQEGLDYMANLAKNGESDAIYVGCGWWTIEMSPCKNDGNCAGCPSHYCSTTGEIWDNGINWEYVADAWCEFERILGRDATSDERLWLLGTIEECKTTEEEEW